MNKQNILCELDAMIIERLFGRRPWLADRDTVAALDRTLTRLGLREQVSDQPGNSRITSLGKELHMELLMVFLGMWDEFEVPIILEDYGLIDEEEVRRLNGLNEDQGAFLEPVVRRAFVDYSDRLAHTC